MYFYTIITGLTAFLGLGLGLFVYFHKPRTNLKISWVIFSFTVGIWSLGYFISLLAINYQTSILSSRFSHASGAFIPITFFHFVLILLRQEARHKTLLRTGYGLSVFMFFSCFSPFVVRDVINKMGILYYPDWGPLYSVYAAMYVWFIAYAHILMTMAIKETKGHERLRIIYLSVASFLGFSGGVSLFLLIFNIPFPPYGSALICLYPIIMSYSIVKHRLMDIEVIIKKTLVFAGLFGVLISVITAITVLAQSYIGQYLGMGAISIRVLSVIIAMLLYDPARKYLVEITDHYLFQKKFDYAKILKDASKDIALVTSFNELTRKMLVVLIHKARTSNAAIYFRDQENDHFELKGCSGFRKVNRPDFKLMLDNPLIGYIAKQQVPITKAQIEEELNSAKDAVNRERFSDILGTIQKMKAEVIVPSFLSSSKGGQRNRDSITFQGILALGKKKSDEDYFEQDLDMLATLAQEHAMTFEIVRLFETMVNEREAKLKAQEEARMVSYSKSLAHETRNAIVGLRWKSDFFVMKVYPFVKNIYDQFVKDKFPPQVEENNIKLIEKIKDEGCNVRSKADELFIVLRTAEGTLSGSEDMFEVFNFTMIWDNATENAKPSRIKIWRDTDKETFFPFGSPVLIKRVLVNLINNAVDAMNDKEDGEVKIKGRFEEIDGKQVAYFEFKDNGPGISAEIQDKIWQQGFSTKPKPKSSDIESSGHGHGLWVCREIIERQHGGKIWVESEIGKGTTFKFWLPMKRPENIR